MQPIKLKSINDMCQLGAMIGGNLNINCQLSLQEGKTMCYHPMHHLDATVHFLACQCLELIFIFSFKKFQPNIWWHMVMLWHNYDMSICLLWPTRRVLSKCSGESTHGNTHLKYVSICRDVGVQFHDVNALTLAHAIAWLWGTSSGECMTWGMSCSVVEILDI